jgi:hypothetical protein
MITDKLPVQRRSRRERKKQQPVRAVKLIRGLLDETAAEDIDGMNRSYAKRWIVSGHEIDHSLVGGYFAGMIFLDFGTAGKRFDIKSKIEVVVLLNGCQRGNGALRTLHSKERHTSNDRTIRHWSCG